MARIKVVASEPRESRQGQTRVCPKSVAECLSGFSVADLLKIGKVVTRLITRKLEAQAKELGVTRSELAAMRKRDPWAKYDGVTFEPAKRCGIARRKRGAA